MRKCCSGPSNSAESRIVRRMSNALSATYSITLSGVRSPARWLRNAPRMRPVRRPSRFHLKSVSKPCLTLWARLWTSGPRRTWPRWRLKPRRKSRQTSHPILTKCSSSSSPVIFQRRTSLVMPSRASTTAPQSISKLSLLSSSRSRSPARLPTSLTSLKIDSI